MFEFESRLGNNIFLDDINIVASGPAGVLDLARPASAPPVLMPNPSSGMTSCAFTLASVAEVAVEVCDASGRRVQVVDAGTLGAGMHRVAIDGAGFAPGMYFVRVVAAGIVGRPVRWVRE